MSSLSQSVEYFQILQTVSDYQFNDGLGLLPPLPEDVAHAMNDELRAKEQCCSGCCICWNCCPPGQKIIDDNFQRIKEFYEELGISLAFSFTYWQEIAKHAPDADALTMLSHCKCMASKMIKNKFLRSFDKVFSIYISNSQKRNSLLLDLWSAANHVSFANTKVNYAVTPTILDAIQQARSFAQGSPKSSGNFSEKNREGFDKKGEVKQEEEELPAEPSSIEEPIKATTDEEIIPLSAGKKVLENESADNNNEQLPEESLAPKTSIYREVNSIETVVEQNNAEMHKTTDLLVFDEQQDQSTTKREEVVMLAEAPQPLALPGQVNITLS